MKLGCQPKYPKGRVALVSVPVEQLGRGLVDEPRLAVVVPGGHAPQARVGAQQRQRRREVLEEVGRNLQVVLNDDHLNIFSMYKTFFKKHISSLSPDRSPSP